MPGKTLGDTVSEAREILRPMALRNLKISLTLKPRLIQLKENLGYSSQMSLDEYLAWKQSKANEINNSIKQLLKEFNVPEYQLPIIKWLFEASESDIDELKHYCKNPSGIPPKAYYLLYAPAYEFSAPSSFWWTEETGYRIAVLTREKAGYWQIWGDLRGIPDKAWWSFIQQSGDFVLRGNLDVFDVDSWRRIGKFLSAFKKERSMGIKLGLVAGGQKGRLKAKKYILRDMTWLDIRNIVAQEPRKYNQLCNEYANAKRKEFVEGYEARYRGQLPSVTEQREARRKAIRNFTVNVRKVRQK